MEKSIGVFSLTDENSISFEIGYKVIKKKG